MSPARALVLGRVALGAIFLYRTTLGAGDGTPLLGWPTHAWTVAVAGLALPAVVVALLCVLRTAGALLFVCGIRPRVAGVVAATSGYLVLAQDRFAFVNSLHVLFSATLVLALTDARKVGPSLRLVGLYLASIYFWAGAAKLQTEWLSGRALEAQLGAGAFTGPLAPWLENAGLRVVAASAVPALELAVAALLVADVRRIAVGLALAFHLAVELTVRPDTLGWQMAVMLLVIAVRSPTPVDGRGETPDISHAK